MVTDNIIQPIFDAMVEVEKRDIRVKRIVIEEERFRQLAIRKSYHHWISNNPFIYPEINRSTNIVAKLFGIDLEIGKENKVYGEEGFLPRRPIEYPPLQFDARAHPCFTADINFGKPKYKLCLIKNNLIFVVKSRADYLYHYSKSEWKAIETLREMLSEKEFKRYLVYGFITVKGKSGKVYQIFRTKAHTKVWSGGNLIEEVCVRIKDKGIPFTDNVIAFKTMIETNEEDFRSIGNVYKMTSQVA